MPSFHVLHRLLPPAYSEISSTGDDGDGEQELRFLLRGAHASGGVPNAVLLGS